MRHRAIREIQHCERAINGEGFGLSLVAREGAAEIRALAGYMRRLRFPPVSVAMSRHGR